MTRINPEFSTQLNKYGAVDLNACFNCGNCTAICTLSDEDNSFPRGMLRASVLGLESKIQLSLDPWLCYYCGECSETCPKTANPGELMMSLRRYLTSVYDWTGISRRFYTSKLFEIGAIAFLAALILGLFLGFARIPGEGYRLTQAGGVALNVFAPARLIHLADYVMAGFLSFFLVSNIFNMYLKTVVKDKSVKIPLPLYIREAWRLVWNFATQPTLTRCKPRFFWVFHFFLVTGYVSLFTMIVLFLPWFQTDKIHAWWHPQRLLGYYATASLLAGITYFTFQRIRKSNQNSKFSHYTDWTFLVLLFLTTVSGILVHLFRISGMALPTYYMYVFHLMVLFPMLMIEVPFSKWSHLAYRPFAVYFANLKKSALALQKSA